MTLYPKMAGPISNKKLYGMPLSAGSPVNSSNTAFIIEYGNAALYNVSSTEIITPTCDNVAQGAITLNAIGGIAPYTYSIDGGSFQTSATFSNLVQGIHTITIKDAACGTATKIVTVPVKTAPVVSAGPDHTIVEGDQVALSGNSVNPATAIVWTPGASIISGAGSFAPIVKPSTTTTYTMTVTNSNGCISSDNALVTVIPYCLKVMNAFTPNGDGMNDRWLATDGPCTKQIGVVVFNRYGNVVYKNDNYQNNWDGTYNGKPVADGTYYYTVNFTSITNKHYFLRGDVTILR
jgi:gliding motility-associated-like protein